MTASFSEDDIYQTSSQYRFWSFSVSGLEDLRARTHGLALERLKRRHGPAAASNGSVAMADYLNEIEALQLVERYCEQIRATSDHFKFPPAVKATAVQYLKRFFLSNSVLTYPPKEIYKTVLFLACKSEGTHIPLSEYARRISTEKDVILAPEYKIMQALRFTLDVKQPFRGLKGVLMELLNMAAAAADTQSDARISAGAPDGLASIDMPPVHAKTLWSARKSDNDFSIVIQDRIQAAYVAARILLDAPCLLTDVYFLYTPSQILLACLQLADPPLHKFYICQKLDPSVAEHSKIIATIDACAEIIATFSEDSIISKDTRAELEERLERCRDPATRDMVKIHAIAIKNANSDEEREKVAKHRSARARHLAEGEQLFGPSLSKS